MNKRRYLTYLTSSFLMVSCLQAADLDDLDIEALRDWINSRRMVTVKELGGQLAISGDVHAEVQSTSEFVNGERKRGGGSSPNLPNYNYDIEFNLSIDYRADRTWAAAKVRFDNDAGVVNEFFGSGKNSNVKVDRAYFGYRVYDRNHHTMDIELGRHPMTTIFDSRIQFGSNFDGALLKDNYAYDKVGDFYYQLGVFIVNEKKYQVAYVGEVGLQNIASTGFYTKYSLIDWNTKKVPIVPQQFQFIISQLIIGYKFVPQPLDKITHFYLAGLYNHRAQKRSITDHKLANAGGYIGFSIGQIKMKGDWSIDANYQVLAAQCVPDFDVQGVGIGNSSGNSFYWHKGKEDGKEKPIPNDRHNAEGNVNFRGFELTFQYLLTNNLNLFQQFKQSMTLNDHIGPFRHYKQYELDFIYLF